MNHNYVNLDVLMSMTRKTTCFGLYWPSSGFLQADLKSYYIYIYIYILCAHVMERSLQPSLVK